MVWADGQEEPIDAVLYATGYQPSLEYLADLGALDTTGRPIHRRGVSTAVPGLAYVGLSNQSTYASATIRGVGPDAAYVIRTLRRQLRGVRPGAERRTLAARRLIDRWRCCPTKESAL